MLKNASKIAFFRICTYHEILANSGRIRYFFRQKFGRIRPISSGIARNSTGFARSSMYQNTTIYIFLKPKLKSLLSYIIR